MKNHVVELSDFEGSHKIQLASSSSDGKQLYAEVHFPSGSIDYCVNFVGFDHQTFGDFEEAIECYNSISRDSFRKDG